MRKPCIRKLGQHKLKIDQHKKVLPKIKELPTITFKNLYQQSQQILKESTNMPSFNQKTQKSDKSICFEDNDVIIQQKFKKVRSQSSGPKNNPRSQMRIKKTFSTNKNFDSNYRKQSQQTNQKGAKCQDSIYCEKRKGIINMLRHNSIISRINSISNSISNINLNKLINTIIFFHQNSAKSPKSNDFFMKQNSFITQIKDIFQDDKENSSKHKIKLTSIQQFKISEKVINPKQKQQITHFNQLISSLKQTQQELVQNIQSLNGKLKQVQKEFNKISHFSSNTSTILITVFGKQYTEIQNQLQQFAVEMEQTNIDDERRKQISPFLDIQIQMIQKLTSISKIINHDDNLSPKQKLDLLKSYLSKTISTFKARDDEVRGTVEQKTNYILKFVQLMKKWHLNWSFKKDYLQNLKKECILTSTDISAKINSLISNERKMTEQSKVVELKQIKVMQAKLYKNFEMSNIFY